MLSALNCSTARAEEITLPAGYVPVNLVTNVGGSASSDTTALGGGYTVSKAFDGEYYSDKTRWIGKEKTFPQHAVWTFPDPTIVDTVRIYNANSDGANQSPSDFTIAGSNDGSDWTTLDTESGVTDWSVNKFRTFQFVNQTPYLKYRLEVTDVQGHNRMTITEIELYRVKRASFDVVTSGSPAVGIDSFSTDWILAVEEGSTADAGLVWSTDESFATATTNSLGTGLAAGTRTASLSGLEAETQYWWKIFATNATDSAETATASFKTTGAPVFGTCSATASGNAATFSVALAEAALDDTLSTAVSVHYGTDGESWTAFPLGSSAAAETMTGSLEDLDYGTTYQWFALATATMEGGRVLSTSTSTNSFTTLWDGDLYVSNGNASAEAPYATWATAAPDVATAISLATDGATIHVAPGRYAISTPLSLTKAVKLVGDDGDPSLVVVSNTANVAWGNANHRCILVNHANAWVSGMTFENGKDYDNGGNVRIDTNGGVVTNCILSGGFTRQGNDSGGANVAITGPGLVTHCKIFGGDQNNCNGGDRVSSVYLEHANARIENCLVEGFKGATVSSQPTVGCAGIVVNKGAAVNCTVADCTSPYTTASGFAGILVWANGVATNCVSVSNVDSNGTVRAFMASQAARTSHCAFDAIDGETTIPEGMPNAVVGTAAEFFKDYANGDYTPKTRGPLVNKGANYEGMASVDLAGKKRLNGSKIDIGCYETSSSALKIVLR
ncbi:MAG: discoidin domain-containing protein [Kiritimatiellae bacterium]|nr:discoidin domain-containing protein [Kiritimatiellia bacterium]